MPSLAAVDALRGCRCGGRLCRHHIDYGEVSPVTGKRVRAPVCEEGKHVWTTQIENGPQACEKCGADQ